MHRVVPMVLLSCLGRQSFFLRATTLLQPLSAVVTILWIDGAIFISHCIVVVLVGPAYAHQNRQLCLRPNCRIDIHGGLHSGGEIVDGVDGHGDAVAAVGE